MSASTDRDLISLYLNHADHDAFAELVERYIRLVHSAALRQTRDPGLADDVTQATMIVLARRAAQIPSNVALASWLFSVTHHIAQNALKIRSRRAFYEQASARQRSEFQLHHNAGVELREMLDEAIERLPELERGSVVLHYLHDCSYEATAGAVGLSPEATRKRVARALERMREFLLGRGVTVSGVALAAAMSSESSSAAVSLASAQPATLALLSASDACMTATRSAALADAMGRTLVLAKWKLAAAIALLVTGLAGIAALPIAAPSAQALVVQASPPTTSPSVEANAVQITPKIKLEFLGSSPHPGDETSWFSIDGQPIEMPNPRLSDNNLTTQNRPDRQIAMLLHAPADVQAGLSVPHTFTYSTSSNDLDPFTRLVRVRFGLDDPAPETATVIMSLATAPWKTVVQCDDLREEKELDGGDYGAFVIKPPERDPYWGTHVDVRHRQVNVITRMLATDDAGKQYEHKTINHDNTGADEAQSSFIFDLPPGKIRGVTIQLREFDKRVEITGIALDAGQHTQPKIEVKDLKDK